MKTRRMNAAVAVAAAGVLALSACTSGGTTDPTSAAEQTSAPETSEATDGATADDTKGTGDELAGCVQDVGITSTVDGEVFFSTGEDEWNGFNEIMASTYSTYNSVINDQMRTGFVYFGADGTICQNTEFGTYEVISGLEDESEPLVIEYTISDDATWSDGTPVTYDDYLLDWASQNPEFLVPGLASGEDMEAKAIFNHVSTSFAQYVPEGPVGEIGGKTFTVEYNTHYPDWQLTIDAALPAHVAAEQSGLTLEELSQAIIDRDAETVKTVAEFWNTGWLSNPGELPSADIAPSSGPYRLMEGGWVAGQSITLEANPDYWGTPAGTDRLTFRFAAADTHVQSLANGELNVIEPQATVDTVDQIRQIGDSVVLDLTSSLTWEHLDFNHRGAHDADILDETTGEPTGETRPVAASAFSDEAGGLAAREAFALCVPRQTIVDTLIAPISPDTVVMNAREVFPFQPAYDDVVSAAYGGEYDAVDIEAAQAKLAESGLTTPVDVRIGYNAPNPRRAETVQLIQASCAEAGFNVIDQGSAAFFDTDLPSGDYDVALFAWAGSGQIASGQNIYSSNKPQNYGFYSNTAVDEAWNTLASSLDPEAQQEQVIIIETELWDTLFGLPLYAHPNVVAYSSNLENVRSSSGQDGVSWNAYQWLLTE